MPKTIRAVLEATWDSGRFANHNSQEKLIDGYLADIERLVDGVIGRDNEPDRLFVTVDGGLSNIGPNYCRNELKSEQRKRLKEVLNDKP